MELQKQNEEKFREACCYGDNDALAGLLARGVDVNCKHNMNGWSGLHWASKRNQVESVQWLIANGADASLMNNQKQTAAELTNNPNILNLLGVETADIVVNGTSANESLPIVPNYIANPPLAVKVELDVNRPTKTHLSNGVTNSASSTNYNNGYQNGSTERQSSYTSYSNNEKNTTSSVGTSPVNVANRKEELVLKIRVANMEDTDFIEMDIKCSDLTYGQLLTLCCRELGVNAQLVERIRKLPNTRLRNDRDIRRLTEYQELEIVMKGHTRPVSASATQDDKTSTSKNAFQSIQGFKNQTILYN
ncbi:unnamed protein product, partial [Meganyctiphanes norvegica]